jgi:hypothetical protein
MEWRFIQLMRPLKYLVPTPYYAMCWYGNIIGTVWDIEQAQFGFSATGTYGWPKHDPSCRSYK